MAEFGLHQFIMFLHAAVGISIAGWMFSGLVTVEETHKGWATQGGDGIKSLVAQALLIVSFVKGLTSLLNGITTSCAGRLGIDATWKDGRIRREHALRYLTSNGILVLGFLLAGLLDSADLDSESGISDSERWDARSRVALIVLSGLPRLTDIITNSIRLFVDVERGRQGEERIKDSYQWSSSQSFRGALLVIIGLIFLGFSMDWDMSDYGYILPDPDPNTAVSGRRLHEEIVGQKSAEACALTDHWATFKNETSPECVCTDMYYGDYCQMSVFVDRSVVFGIIAVAVAVISGIVKLVVGKSASAGTIRGVILAEDVSSSIFLGLATAYLAFEIGSHLLSPNSYYIKSESDEGAGQYQLLAVGAIFLAYADQTLADLSEDDDAKLYELPSEMVDDARERVKTATERSLNLAATGVTAVAGIASLYGAFTLNRLLHAEYDAPNYSSEAGAPAAAPSDGPNVGCDSEEYLAGLHLAEYGQWIIVIMSMMVIARALFAVVFGEKDNEEANEALTEKKRRKDQLAADILFSLAIAIFSGFKAEGSEASRCKAFASTSYDTTLWLVLIGAILIRVVDTLRFNKGFAALVKTRAESRGASKRIEWANPNASFLAIMLAISGTAAGISHFGEGEAFESEVGSWISIFHLVAFIGICVHFLLVALALVTVPLRALTAISGIPLVRLLASTAVLSFLSASVGAELFNLGLRGWTPLALLSYIAYDICGAGWI